MLTSNPVAELEKWLSDGHQAALAGKSTRACEAWLQCWDVFLPRLPPGKLPLEEAQRFCPELAESLVQWLRDLDEELAEAGVRSASYRQRRLQFCDEVLAHLELCEDRLNFLGSRACSLWDLNDRAGAEIAFLHAAKEFPHEAGAFVRWGDCWAFDRTPDFEQAAAIYRKGLEPPEQCDLRTISHRLEMLDHLKDRATLLVTPATSAVGKPSRKRPQ